MAQVPLPPGGRRKKSRAPASPRARYTRRVTLLTASFCAVCLTYAVLLIVFGSKGNAFSIYKEKDHPAGTTVQTVTLQASRGEIYDCNGKALVTNRYSYDLTVDYDPFLTATGPAARNARLLSLLSLLSAPEAGTLTEDSFPLSGTYPDLTYTPEALDPTTTVGRRLEVLLGLLDLPANSTADQLVAYYVDTYALGAKVDGIPAYTGEQITALLKIYYDMDLCHFGPDAPEYILAKNLSAATVAAVLETDSEGTRITMRSERVYHYPGYASHILGRVNKIFAEDWEHYSAQGYPMNAVVGSTGCEAAFESVLRGTDGLMEITLDQNGRTISTTILEEPVAGRDIRLTIDIDLQIAAEDALADHLNSPAGRGAGAVVVTDPATGAYLALASYPTYDLSTFSEDFDNLNGDTLSPLLCRALSATYGGGELLTLSTALGGLCEGVVTPTTLWNDAGMLTVDGTHLFCPLFYTNDDAHGTLGLQTALEDGCLVFLGRLGLSLGGDRLALYQAALGLGQKTGIELAESAGTAATILPDSQLSVLQAALGQTGATMTPAQMASYLATILTGGTRYQGYILQDVRSFTSGDVLSATKPQALSYTALSTEARQLIYRVMEGAAAEKACLADLISAYGAKGFSVGIFSAESYKADGGTPDGLTVGYVRPAGGVYSGEGGMCVSVVVEKGMVDGSLILADILG